jgi:chromosome segregation ATPase
MDSATLSQTVSRESRFSDTLDQLETYEDLSHQLDRYTTLLENAERHRYSVRPGTYEKVRDEYAEKQSSLKKSREEQGVLLQKEIQRFLQEQSHLRAVCDEQEDRMEEIAFRVSVGEFPEHEIQSEKRELEQRLLNHTTDLEKIGRILSRSIQIGLLQETVGPEERDDQDQGETVAGVTALRFWRRRK